MTMPTARIVAGLIYDIDYLRPLSYKGHLPFAPYIVAHFDHSSPLFPSQFPIPLSMDPSTFHLPPLLNPINISESPYSLIVPPLS